LGNANLRFVSFNKKPIYFRSGQTRRELISIALDAAVIDEFDEFENPISVVPTLEMRFLPFEVWLLAWHVNTHYS
jgi:hypothetical protein